MEQAKSTAERILEAASMVLSAEGYAGLSMRRVAARVGLSQAAIYRHFTDKDQLVSTIVERGYGMLSASMERLGDSGDDPASLLADGIRAYIDFAGENTSLFKAVMLQDIGPSRERVDAFSPGVERRRKTFQTLAALVRRGVAEGIFEPCDVEVTAQAVWAAMFGLASRMAIEPDRTAGSERRHEIIERHIEILVRGMRGRKA